jgi:hypothetical protein
MPKTNRETRLRDKDGTVIALVSKGVLVEIIGPPKDDSVHVKVPTEPGAPTGFLLKAHVDDEDPAPAPIDKAAFARECAFQESAFGVSGHYLAAIAQLRSGIVDGKAGDGFGLYRLLMEEWKADWNTKEFEFTFAEEDIHQWRNQCTLFAVMARRTLDAYVAAFSTRPNAVELYLAQLIGVEAMRLSKDNPTMTIKAALSTAGAGKIPPGPSDPDERIKRHPGILKSGETPSSRQQAGAQAEVQLNAALVATKALFAAAKVTELSGASDQVGLGYNPNSPAIPPGTHGIAQLIVRSFADAGYGVVQQVAALANAIAESGLNPAAQSRPPEMSFGLFQCNLKGEGHGHDPEDLKRPDFNIAIIIKAANRTTLKNATTLDDAVRIFVHDIERPADKPGETTKRQAIAARLIA